MLIACRTAPADSWANTREKMEESNEKRVKK
jgi:hypothetical protein